MTGQADSPGTVKPTSLSPFGILSSLALSSTEINQGVLYSSSSASDPSVRATSNGNVGGDDVESGKTITTSYCPATGQALGRVQNASESEVPLLIASAHAAFLSCRSLPAPQRGLVLLTLRHLLASSKQPLGLLLSLEMGKSLSEGLGEIQEAIDICDYAIGLSRTLSGKVIPSERSQHILMETPSPLGVVVVVTAFNFPHAVWFWNFAISFVCGNATVWKPAPSTPLIAIASIKLIHQALASHNLPTSLASLCCGPTPVSSALIFHPLVALVSFTGSEATGRIVSSRVAGRLGKTILELGGNNAVVVLPDADMELALRTVLFGAIGTAGQRCTTTRRLLLHESLAERFLERLGKSYRDVIEQGRIGDPLLAENLMGPVHSQEAVTRYNEALQEAKKQGGRVLVGGEQVKHRVKGYEGGNWVTPAIVYYGKNHPKIMEEETFAPILHVTTFETLDEAIALNNRVRQGLSSSLFTKSMQSVFHWLGPAGSDCGIVNVNQSTSGAEIGAGFGGNKATGWGRESGGDAWKQYCSWKSATVNFGNELGLAQGLTFE